MIIKQIKMVIMSKRFIKIIFIGILMHFFSVINEILPYISLQGFIENITNTYSKPVNGVMIDDVFNKFSFWCDSMKGYMLFIPILSALPFSTSFNEDVKSGMIKFINTRISHNKYIFSKIVSNFIVGGLIVVIPTIVWSVITFILFNGDIKESYISVAFGGMYNKLFLENFLMYFIFHIIIEFLIGAVYSSIALAISTKVKNNIGILLSPYIFYIGTSVIFTALNINYLSTLRVNQFYFIPTVSIVEISINLSIIFIISTALFIKFSTKKEIYEKGKAER